MAAKKSPVILLNCYVDNVVEHQAKGNTSARVTGKIIQQDETNSPQWTVLFTAWSDDENYPDNIKEILEIAKDKTKRYTLLGYEISRTNPKSDKPDVWYTNFVFQKHLKNFTLPQE